MDNNKTTKIKLVGLNARYVHSCLALFYVRNELRKNGIAASMDILQATINDNYYELLLKLSGGSPDYLFFSAAIWNSDIIEKLTRDLVACLPSVRVIIGGPQASTLSKKLGPKLCTTVIGSIENVGSRFYRDFKDHALQASYIANGIRSDSVRDSTSSGFDYPYTESDFEEHLANRNIYYESSRGCPFRCSYCLSATDRKVYHKDLPQVEEELGDILKHKPKVVRFVDRTFNDLPDRALAIWKFLSRNGGETLFHFEMAPDRFTDEMFAFLTTIPAGLFQFEIGIQSTNPATLEAISRKMNLETAAAAIARLASLGNIHLHVDLILGLPYETEETFAQSFRDIFAMGAHYIQMGLLKILPDTPICHAADDFGYLHQQDPPYSVLANNWLTHAQLSRMYWFCECVERFMNNRYFVSFWEYLRKSSLDIFRFFSHLLDISRENALFDRAPTQEFLVSLLVQAVDAWQDRKLIIELLRYDWLRCGFKCLPESLKLADNEESQEALRSQFSKTMPASVEGVYSTSNRNYFFRKTYFLIFSRDALQHLGYLTETKNSCLCFLAEREESVHRFNRVLMI